MTTPPYKVFIQHRPDIVSPEDRVFVRLDHVNSIEGYSNWLIQASDPRPVHEGILIHESLEAIRNVVPKFCADGETFFTIAHTTHDDPYVQYRLDYDRIVELARELECELADIEIIEVIYGDTWPLQKCAANRQPALTYFSSVK